MIAVSILAKREIMKNKSLKKQKKKEMLLDIKGNVKLKENVEWKLLVRKRLKLQEMMREIFLKKLP